MSEEILENAKECEITREEALYLFRERSNKPGDSLETKRFAESIDNIGLGLYTVLMVGLGGVKPKC